VDGLSEIADVVIDSDRCTEEDVPVRVASHLRLYGEESAGWADVIVGGQYGSEGKGQIAAYLASDYDLLVRVGGPNAGHKVFERPVPYTHHQLPSGTRRTARPRLLIGAGAVLNVGTLLKEISECNVDANRLKIDHGAMVIIEEDFATESDLVKGIGSTGQGVGSATSRRILHRNLGTKLAKDVPQLEPFMCNALEVLQDAFAANGRVCLEGLQ
jgi:adenylosuccinate synthase